MIADGVLDFLASLAGFVIGLLPSGNAPGWLTGFAGHLDPVFAAAAGLGAWVPWSLVGTVAGWVMGCLIAGFLIKVVRIIVSFLTVGGGSAG